MQKAKDNLKFIRSTYVEIKCENCGKKFELPKSKKALARRFCSRKCFGEWERGKNHPQYGKKRVKEIKRNCQYCNKTFIANEKDVKRGRAKFCSRECMYASWSKKVKRVCVTCGKEFEAKAFAVKKGQGIYCSKDCRRTGEYRTCEICSKKFYVKRVYIKDGYGKYCSNECRHLGRRNRVKKECLVCGKEFEIIKIRDEKETGNYCSRECYHEAQLGPSSRGLAAYDTFAEQLSYADDVRRDPKDNEVLQSKCAYCGRWFTPTKWAVATRLNALKGRMGGEGRFYCSDRCKLACPTYKKLKYPEGFKKATSREVQAQLRQMVFEIDNWECKKCEKTIDESELHCHHITGVEQNPIESADVENCITLCKKCHRWAHTAKGCRYYDLRYEAGLR